MENNLLTAKQFFKEELSGEPLTEESVIVGLIEFAKLHCEAQLKVILENAKTKTKMIPYTGVRAGGSFPVEVIDKDSIINAYPLDLIK